MINYDGKVEIWKSFLKFIDHRHRHFELDPRPKEYWRCGTTWNHLHPASCLRLCPLPPRPSIMRLLRPSEATRWIPWRSQMYKMMASRHCRALFWQSLVRGWRIASIVFWCRYRKNRHLRMNCVILSFVRWCPSLYCNWFQKSINDGHVHPPADEISLEEQRSNILHGPNWWNDELGSADRW